MNTSTGRVTSLSAFLCLCLLVTSSRSNTQETGFKRIFNGQTLQGWQVRQDGFWTVEDGAIVGQTTEAHPAPVNQFISWQQGEVDDFELKLSFRFTGRPAANGGVQIRSRVAANGHVVGYQADMNKGAQYIGMLYDEGGRGILSPRGKRVTIDAQGKKSTQSLAHAEALEGTNRDNDWNDYHIKARGNKITLKVNGLVTSEFTDDQASERELSGVIAFQLHQGPPMKVEYRDIRLKRLPLTERKKLVFIAGRASHNYAAHAHNAGALLLARLLNENVPQILAVAYQNGWPQDPTALDNADAVVMYCDGGKAHVLTDPSEALARLDQVDQFSQRGKGVALLHYALIPPEAPDGGRYFTHWIGGYYKTHWSVNPFWTAEVKALPAHPITQGVQPFSIHDEWYYHMKFREDMLGVTPLLSAIPPDATRKRAFGPHSGNRHVRARMGQPEHIAWCAQGTHRARGFGFTGAHPHWNWAHDGVRKLMLNALVWITGLEVPPNGVLSKRPSLAELEANQDAPKPQNYDPVKIQRMIDSWR